MISQNRKGALELSIGTIVILVLAMSMLILGLVLVKNIFGTANDSIDKVRSATNKELDKLFSDESRKLAINLPNNQIDISKNSDAFIGFAIKNIEQNTNRDTPFGYEIVASSVESNCRGSLTEARATQYIVNGQRKSGIMLSPGGDPSVQVAQISVPSDAPLCTIFYDVRVTKEGSTYAADMFIVNIVGS